MAIWIFTSLLLLQVAIHESIQKSNPESPTYRAAVVELKPFEYTNDSVKTLNDNAEKIITFIKQAAQREVDIVVFPELGLTSLTLGQRSDMVSRSTLIPDPSQNYTPCTNSSIPVIEALRSIACAVERNGIYVVVNLIERELCSLKNCPSDGLFIYLTSVTFDRQGRIIARSRKNHMVNNSPLINTMEISEPSTFDTDFGVKFGSIVCFDIWFEDALLKLKRELNITDIVHVSGWFSTMPFLTTIQMEAGWTHVEDVNLLSSGYNSIERGNSGSGIYAGRQGFLTAVMPLTDHEELLVADVPKKNTNIVAATPISQYIQKHDLRLAKTDQNHDSDTTNRRDGNARSFNWRYEDFDGFESKLISENGFTVEKLSHVGIECEFRVNITNLSPMGVTYRLLAFNGAPRASDVLVLGTKICAIVLCANDTIKSCGHVWDTSATLNTIDITAIHVNNGRTIMMPNTLLTNMLPFKNWTWNQYKLEERIYTSMSLSTPTQNLITFGCWGRNFEKDFRSLA